MSTNKLIKSIIYELLLIDRNMINFVPEESKDSFFSLLEQEREERIDKVLDILRED